MEGASAGIDWASEEHALCVVDAAGRKLAGELFGHDEAGIRQLLARMRTGCGCFAPTPTRPRPCGR